MPDNRTSRMAATLGVCNFLSKGWEVAMLGLLAFLQQSYSLPLYIIGILSTVFIVSQISTSLCAGRIAHALGSRDVILLTIAINAVAWVTLSLTHTEWALYLPYALGGVASGLFEPIGNSIVARTSQSRNRGRTIGNFAAFGDMGRIAVVAVATALAGWIGISRACAAMTLSNVVALVLAAVFLRDSRTPQGSDETHSATSIAEMLKNCRFRFATAAGIADSFSSASLYIFIPFLLEAKGIRLSNTLYFNVIFFAGYMAGRLVLGRIADRSGAATTLIISEVCMALLIVLLTLSSETNAIFIVLFVLGIFTRGTSPIIRAMVADSMESHATFHDAFSAYSFASRSASAACRPVYGYLAAYAGIPVVFYLASAVSIITLYPAMRYMRDGSRRAAREPWL